MRGAAAADLRVDFDDAAAADTVTVTFGLNETTVVVPPPAGTFNYTFNLITPVPGTFTFNDAGGNIGSYR